MMMMFRYLPKMGTKPVFFDQHVAGADDRADDALKVAGVDLSHQGPAGSDISVTLLANKLFPEQRFDGSLHVASRQLRQSRERTDRTRPSIPFGLNFERDDEILEQTPDVPLMRAIGQSQFSENNQQHT